MESNATPFLHLFVFQCPQCRSPSCEFELHSLSNDELCDAAETCAADAFLPECSSISEILAAIRGVQPAKG